MYDLKIILESNEKISSFIWLGYSLSNLLETTLYKLCYNKVIDCIGCKYSNECLAYKLLKQKECKGYLIDSFKEINNKIIFNIFFFIENNILKKTIPLILFEINQSKLTINKDKKIDIYIKEATLNDVTIFSKNSLYIRNIQEDILLKKINEKILKIIYLKPTKIGLFFLSPTKFKKSFKDNIIKNFLKEIIKRYHDITIDYNLGEKIDKETEEKILKKIIENFTLINYEEIPVKMVKINEKNEIKNEMGFFKGFWSYKIKENFYESMEGIQALKILLFGEKIHVGKYPEEACGKYKLYYDFR